MKMKMTKQIKCLILFSVMILMNITQIHAETLINTTAPWIPNTNGTTVTNSDGSVTMTRPDEAGYKFLFIRLSQTGRGGALSRDLVAGEKITVKIRAKSSSTKSWIMSKFLDFKSRTFKKENVYEDFIFETTVKANISPYAWLGLFLEKTGDTVTVKSIEIDEEVTPPATKLNTWYNTSIIEQTGRVEATFTATPSAENIDSVMGFANTQADAYTDLGMIVRFSPSGNIDARNGDSYNATTSINYEANKVYTFRLLIDFNSKKYSIYVTAEGEAEVLIGENYNFRTEQNTLSSIASMAHYSTANGVVNVSEVTFTDVDTTPPVITLNGVSPLNLKVGETYTELRATATDDVDGDVSADIIIDSSAVDTSKVGTYLVSYTVSDSKKNKSTKNRKVIVNKANDEPIEGGSNKESAVAINVNEDLTLLATYPTFYKGKPQREAWYRFELTNTSNVTITYTAPDDGGSYIDISSKKSNWTGSGTTANVGPITLEAGTHYIYINKEGDEIQNIDFKITLTGTTPTKGAKIFVIGDSTVHNHDKEDGGYPLKGWADSLGEYMIHPENLYNKARSGASSKSYKIENKKPKQYDWPETKRLIKGMDISKGAYLLIQFGHNDENPRPHLYTKPGRGKSFYNELKVYVDEAKDMGIIPVLITPLERQVVGRYTHGAYPQTVRDLARIEKVLLLDLTEKSYTEFNKYPSDEAIHKVFGYKDHTHLTVESSKIVAGWIRDLACKLSDKRLCNQFKPSNNIGGNIFEINFNKYQNKTEYTKDMLEKDFGKSENDGIGHDGLANASLVKDGTDTVFKVTYKENTFGPENGFQAAVFLNKVQSGQTVTLEYSFKFNQNFDWAEGGKLPGLAGGSMPTGGQLLNASSLLNTGFSDRFVWHKNGGIHHYIYHPEQIEAYQGDKQPAWKCIKVIKDGTPKVYGIGPYLVNKNVDQYTDINIASRMLNNNNPDGQCVYRPKYKEMIENKITFSKNKWYKIRQSIKPNNKGKSDGTIDVWINDNLVSSIHGVKLIADNKEYKIDRLLFSTFYGGGNEDYAPDRDTSIYFKNIKIFTK